MANEGNVFDIQPNKDLVNSHRPLMKAPNKFLLNMPDLAVMFIRQHGGAENIPSEDMEKIKKDVDEAINELAYRN